MDALTRMRGAIRARRFRTQSSRCWMLGAEDRARLLDAVDIANVFDEIDAFSEAMTPEREAPFVREWVPPEELARLDATSVDALILDLANLDLRWRLDAYLVIEQFLDD